MEKTFGKRLLSGVTALLLTATTLSSGSFVDINAAADDPPVTKLNGQTDTDPSTLLAGNSSLNKGNLKDTIDAYNSEYLLGVASDFCVFLEEDFTVTDSDAEGRVAIGGTFTGKLDWGPNYSIGIGDYWYHTPLDDLLVDISVDDNGNASYSSNRLDAATIIVGGYVEGQFNDTYYDEPYETDKNGVPGLFRSKYEGPGSNDNHGNPVLSPKYKTNKKLVLNRDYPLPNGLIHDGIDTWNNYNIPWESYAGDWQKMDQRQTYVSNMLDFKEIFETAEENLANTSLNLLENEDYGTITYRTNADGTTTITFTYKGDPTDKKDCVYFNLKGEDYIKFKDASYVEFENIPELTTPRYVINNDGNGYTTWENSYIIVNVHSNGEGTEKYYVANSDFDRGQKYTTINGVSISRVDSNDDDPSKNNDPGVSSLLYNFPYAEEVVFGNNFQGTVLAPKADVTDIFTEKGWSNGTWVEDAVYGGATANNYHGHLSGALIAKSFYGATEFGYRPFNAPASIKFDNDDSSLEVTKEWLGTDEDENPPTEIEVKIVGKAYKDNPDAVKYEKSPYNEDEIYAGAPVIEETIKLTEGENWRKSLTLTGADVAADWKEGDPLPKYYYEYEDDGTTIMNSYPYYYTYEETTKLDNYKSAEKQNRDLHIWYTGDLTNPNVPSITITGVAKDKDGNDVKITKEVELKQQPATLPALPKYENIVDDLPRYYFEETEDPITDASKNEPLYSSEYEYTITGSNADFAFLWVDTSVEFTNAYKYNKVTIDKTFDVEKIWADDEAAYRETVEFEFTVTGKVDGKVVYEAADKAVLPQNGKWEVTVEDLPYYYFDKDDQEFKLIEYTIEEVKVAGYEASYPDTDSSDKTLSAENKYLQEEASVTVTKDWDFGTSGDTKATVGDVDVHVVVKNGDKTVYETDVTLGESNGWTWDSADDDDIHLPKYDFTKGGEEIEYEVTASETKVDGYDTDYNGNGTANVTVVNTYVETVIEYTNVTVSKKWDDSKNPNAPVDHSKDTVKIKVKVFADGEDITATIDNLIEENGEYFIEITGDGTWESSDLVKLNDKDEEIEYTVEAEEVVGDDDYKAKYDGNNTDDVTVINAYIEKTNVTVSKKWDDTDNKETDVDHSNDTVKIKVKVSANGKDITATLKNVEYDTEGEYYYVELTGTKTWKSSDLVKLDDNDKEIEYTVEAEEVVGVADYEADDNGTNGTDKVTITNKYVYDNTKSRGELRVNKTWENYTGFNINQPTVEFKLTATIDDVEKVFEGEWDSNTYTLYVFEDLPVYQKDGKTLVEYTLTETLKDGEVTGYEVTGLDKTFTLKDVDGSFVSEADVTNTYTAVDPLKITKNWGYKEDGATMNEVKPVAITVQVVGTIDDGKTTIYDRTITLNNKDIEENDANVRVTVNSDGSWSYEIEDLPRFYYKDGDAYEVTYTITEIDVPAGYESDAKSGKDATLVGENEYTVEINNTYQQTSIEYTIEKVWNDNNDEYGFRPTLDDFADYITVKMGDTEYTFAELEAKGYTVEASIVDGKYVYKISGLPEYEYDNNGNWVKVEYYITEGDVPGYVRGVTSSTTGLTRFTNNLNTKGYVSIRKVDAEGDGILTGVSFELYDVNDKLIATWDSAETDESITGLIPGIQYTLKEVEPKEGYDALTGDIVFTVDEKGVVTIVSGAPADYELGDGVIIIKNSKTVEEVKKSSVKIDKRDIANDEEVVGAKLKVVDKDGNTIYEWESDGTVHTIEGLIPGEEYTLHEDGAPDGYEEISTDIVFTVDEDGNVTIVSASDDDYKLSDDNKTLIVNDAKKTTSVNIDKRDIANDEEVVGAKLKVVDKDGNIVDEWESDGTVHTIEGLIPGEEYTLHEENAPEGYEEISTDIKFIVDEDGNVTVVDANEDDYDVSDDGKTLIVNDTKIKEEDGSSDTSSDGPSEKPDEPSSEPDSEPGSKDDTTDSDSDSGDTDSNSNSNPSSNNNSNSNSNNNSGSSSDNSPATGSAAASAALLFAAAALVVVNKKRKDEE